LTQNVKDGEPGYRYEQYREPWELLAMNRRELLANFIENQSRKALQ